MRLDGDGRRGFSAQECIILSRWLEEAGHTETAAQLLRRCLTPHAPTAGQAEAYLELGQLRLRQGQVSSAYQHLMDVLDHEPSPEVAILARQGLVTIEALRRRP